MAETASRPAFVPRLPWRTIGVALVILALVIGAAAVYVGSHQTRLPAPFGPAANGLIPYSSNGDIYVGDPATGTSRLVLGGTGDDVGPSYSPDGTRIGFLRTVSPTDVDIYSVRPDGSELRRLTPSPVSNLAWAQWSPDSRSIAILSPVPSAVSDCGTSTCLGNQLVMLDATGSAPARTIATADRMDYVQFRPPDGDALLYRALVDGKWGLFAMDADGKNPRPIVPASVPAEVDMSFAYASYSADGSRIFYNHGDESGCCRLWVVNADGTDAHEFLPLGPAWDGEAVPSPDGTRIAYWHNPNDGPEHGITVAHADGTGPVVETGPKLTGSAHWIWSPDSTKILMFPDNTDIGTAYLLDPAGGQWTTVPWSSGGDLDWQRLAPTN